MKGRSQQKSRITYDVIYDFDWLVGCGLRTMSHGQKPSFYPGLGFYPCHIQSGPWSEPGFTKFRFQDMTLYPEKI